MSFSERDPAAGRRYQNNRWVNSSTLKRPAERGQKKGFPEEGFWGPPKETLRQDDAAQKKRWVNSSTPKDLRRGGKRKGSPRKDFGIPQRPAETGGGGERKVTSAEEDKGAGKKKGFPIETMGNP